MVWCALANGSGQVVPGIRLEDPNGNLYTVIKTSRKGINQYELTLIDSYSDEVVVFNHEIHKKKDPKHFAWKVYGSFFTPEELAKKFGRKLDPDANLPRPQRESFWKMKSKPGTFNYRQKKRLMSDPFYINKFGHLFKGTLHEEL